MKKIASVFSLSLLLAVSACSSLGTSDSSSSSSSEESSMRMDDSSSSESSAMSEDASSSEMTSEDFSGDDSIRVINMTVENWAFVPASVSVKKGERVVIRLTNTSGVHSFMSSDLGLNVAIQAGETKDIEIPTDETGTFSFRCGVPCGPGHMDMKGSIVVG